MEAGYLTPKAENNQRSRGDGRPSLASCGRPGAWTPRYIGTKNHEPLINSPLGWPRHGKMQKTGKETSDET